MTMAPQKILTNSAIDIFASFDPKSVALLFDVDGTLVEISQSPFEVDVPEELLGSLLHLSELTGGAIALVSGRPIVDLDHLFAPLKLPAVGGHGAELRLRADQHRSSPTILSEAFRRRLAEAAQPR